MFNYYLIVCIIDFYLYLSECLNKKIKVIFKISGCKMKHSKLCCEKSLVMLTKFGAKDRSTGLHGVIALFSHVDGTKHKERLPKYTPISFFKRTEPSSSASTLLNNDAGHSNEASSSKQTAISICTNKQLVIKVEIIWTLDVFMSKYSFNSSSNKSDLCTTMFSDSKIAKKKFLWKNKMWVHCEVWNCT